MDRSNSRFFEAANNAANQAQQEQPPGVDQPALIDPFNHDFSGSLPSGVSQPDDSGFIRRPAGWTPIPAGNSTATPQGGATPLSAALSRVIAADAALHQQAEVPPPGSGPPVTHEGPAAGSGHRNPPSVVLSDFPLCNDLVMVYIG